MSQYDYIVIGAGMGGLSVGNFLTKHGKKVLILEKESYPGGQVHSFKRQNFFFDASVTHFKCVSHPPLIGPFLSYWGQSAEFDEVSSKFIGVTKNRRYIVRSSHLAEDLIKAFPDEEKQIKKYVALRDETYRVLTDFKTRTPPWRMTFKHKIDFVIDLLFRKRIVAKYSNRDYKKWLQSLFKNQELINFIFSLHPTTKMTAFFHLFTVGAKNFYPAGGMAGFSNTLVDIFKRQGGELRYRSEVKEVLLKDGKAVGVLLSNGEKIYGDAIISNSSPFHTFGKLVERSHASPLCKDMMENRGLGDGSCFLYLGIDKNYKMAEGFNGGDFLVFPNDTQYDLDYNNYTPETSPLLLYKIPRQDENGDYAILVGTVMPYEYKNCWGTDGTKERNENYYKIKEEVVNTLIKRLVKLFGNEFEKSIKFKDAATPITYERYSYAEKGGMLGWSFKNWKLSFSESVLPFETPVKNLYLVGQYTFPIGAIGGSLSSGLFLARDLLLESDGIDLHKEMDAHRKLATWKQTVQVNYSNA